MTYIRCCRLVKSALGTELWSNVNDWKGCLVMKCPAVNTDNTKNAFWILCMSHPLIIPVILWYTVSVAFFPLSRCLRSSRESERERERGSQWRQGVLSESQALTHQETLLGSEAVVVGRLSPRNTARAAGQPLISEQHWCRIRARSTAVTSSPCCPVCLSSVRTYLWPAAFQSAFQLTHNHTQSPFYTQPNRH